MNGLGLGVYSSGGDPTYPLFTPTLNGTYYLENTDPTGLPVGDAARSVFCWIKVPFPTTTQVIFGYGSTGNDSQQTELIYNDSYRELSVYWNQVFSPVAYYGNSDFVLAANTWYLVGATYNSGDLNLYVGVNGRLSSRGCGTGGLSTVGQRIRIGLGLHHFSAIENIFKGTVAKAGIWNRELNYSEVNDLFNAGRVDYINLPYNLRHVTTTNLSNSIARTNQIANLTTRNVETANLCSSTSATIGTSSGFTLTAKTGIIKTLETSNGWTLSVCKPIYSNIKTSTGAFLKFAKRNSVIGGVVSYWNLHETDGVRHDSLGNNHLNCMQLYAEIYVASFDVPIGAGIEFSAPNPLATSWFWDFGDENTSTEQNPTHVFENEGSFVVTLSVNGGSKHTAETRSLTASITMTTHTPVASFTSNAPKTVGSAITFTDTSSYPFGSWSWDFGDETTSTNQNPNHTYSEAGDYTVILTIANGAASVSHSVSVNIATIELSTPVDLSSFFNVIGLVPEGDAGEGGSGVDGGGPGTGSNGIDQNVLFANYSNPVTVGGIDFRLQSGNVNNAMVCGEQEIPLYGKFDTIYLLGFGVNGGAGMHVYVDYTDNTTADINQGFSDWFTPLSYPNETVALGEDFGLVRSDNNGPIYVYKYKLAIDSTKTVFQIRIPGEQRVIILSMTAANTIPQMNMWLRGDKIAASDNDSISAWVDKSGNGNNALQNSIGIFPQYKTNIINGLPAVYFAASGSSGSQYASGKYLTCNISNNGPYSVFAVVKNATGTGEFSVALSWGQSGGTYNFWTGYIPDSSSTAYPGQLVVASDSHSDIYATPTDDTNWHISEGIFDGTHLSGWSTSNLATGAGAGASGNQVSSGTLAGNTVNIGCYIDGSYFWNGYVAEVMLFPSALSSTEREAIEAYLITKYDLGSQNEIQQFSFNPTPISGTYTITADGNTTGPINWNASAGDIQDILSTTIGNNVSVS